MFHKAPFLVQDCIAFMRSFSYPLSNIIKKHKLQYYTYADDTQIYMRCKDNVESINEAISKLENCIREASDWMKQNSLKINEDKTEFIIFSNKPKTKDCHSLSVDHNCITLSHCIKILGVTLDNKMTLTKHISETCRSAYMHNCIYVNKKHSEISH